jgi:hypothetical protein
MERLFKAFRDLFAPVRGALYLVVLLTATLFGIAAGTVGATVVLLGIMAGPMMIKSGYDARMSAGAITAGGTLGILIPPSVMLVVMGPVLGVSVLQLYAAAFGPASCSPACTSSTPWAQLHRIRSSARRCRKETRPTSKPCSGNASSAWCRSRCSTIATLGVILAGITTSTEAAAMGAAGAILLVIATAASPGRACSTPATARSHAPAWCCSSRSPRTSSARCSRARHRELDHQHAARRAAAAVGHDDAAADAHLPARLAVRVAGDRADLPADARAGGDRWATTWCVFGTIVAVVLQTAFLSPPVAMSAYYLKQVVKDWSMPRHLSRHVRLHGDPGAVRGAGARVPADRDVVPGMARGRRTAWRRRCRKTTTTRRGAQRARGGRRAD